MANGGNLDGAEEPLRVYLTVYLTLTAHHDTHADQILEDAHSLLQEQVKMIQNRTDKEKYVQNVPWRREIEELWKQSHSTKKQDT